MLHIYKGLLKSVGLLKRGKIVAVVLVVLCVAQVQVFAGGRPVGKKRLYIVPTIGYFFNHTYWDPQGVKQTYANDGGFKSAVFAVDAEYGFSRRLSLVANIPIVYSQYHETGFTNTSFGPADAEFGARYYFANINYNIYFSVQGAVIVPLYQNTATRNLGYGKLGTDLQLLNAGSFALGPQKFYYEAAVIGKQYFGTVGPVQVNYQATLAWLLGKKNTVALGGNSLHSYSNDKDFTPGALVVSKNFSYTQITLTYSHSFQRNKSVFASVSKFLVGKNTGIGNFLSVGYVYKY